jgi:hypothetical protein
MEIDLSTAVPVNSNNVAVPASANRIDLSSAVPADSDISMRMSKDKLTTAFNGAKIWKQMAKPDIGGQAVNATAAFALDSTVNFAANTADLVSDMNMAVIDKKADKIRAKRATPGYNWMLDINSFADSMDLAISDRNKAIPGIAPNAGRTNVFDKFTESTNEFLRKNFPQKTGMINEWTYKLINGGLSIPQSMGLMKAASALTASRLAQAMTPAFVIGGQQAAGVSEEAEMKGKSFETRLDVYFKDLVAQGALEAVGMDFMKNGLRGVRLIEKGAIDGVNNMSQEVLQSLSEDGIRIMSGLSYETMSQVAQKAWDNGIVGAVVGTGSSFVANAAEGRTIIGDFQRIGASYNDIEMAFNLVQENDYKVAGVLASDLMQKGVPENVAQGMEKTISDLGYKQVFQSAVWQTVVDMRKHGLSVADSIKVAETIFKSQDIEGAVQAEFKKMIDQVEEISGFEEVFHAALNTFMKNGKPDSMTSEQWAGAAINSARIAAHEAVTEGKKRGIPALQRWEELGVEVDPNGKKVDSALQQGPNEEILSAANKKAEELGIIHDVRGNEEWGYLTLDDRVIDPGTRSEHDPLAKSFGLKDAKGAIDSGLVRFRNAAFSTIFQVAPGNAKGLDAINFYLYRSLDAGASLGDTVFLETTDKENPASFTLQEWMDADQDVRKFLHTTLQQSGVEKKNLVAMHNLTADKLIHAERIGGLAVPSLSIGKVEHPLEGFGDITLIGSKELIDPKKASNKVFNADIYSPRYPSVKYDFSSQGLSDARKTVAQEEKDLGRDLGGDLDSDSFNRKGMEALYGSAVLQLKYLRSIGKDIEIPKKAPNSEYLRLNPDIEKFVQDWSPPSDLYKNEEFLKEYEKLRQAVMDDAARKSVAAGNSEIEAMQDADAYGAGWYEEDGNPNYNIIRQLMDAADEKKTAGRPDYYAGARLVHDEIRKYQKSFQEWVDRNYSGIIGKERLYNGEDRNYNARYLPHTLENVVRVMKRELQSGEGFNYGLGNVRASVAKRYASIRDIQGDRNKILSKAEFEKVKEFTDEEFDAIIADAYASQGEKSKIGDGDRFVNILIDGIKNRNIEKELTDYGYGSMDMDRIKAFLDTIRNMPTEYFEAKIQRAVSLNEFSGAVVPVGTDDKAIRVLERNNIPYVKYDPKKEGDRARVIKEFSENNNVLFQSNLGFYSKAEQVIKDKIPNNVDSVQLINTLKNNGVKQDEIEQLGLDTLTGKISKEDLLTLVKANQVPLEEKVLSPSNLKPIEDKLFNEGYKVEIGRDGDAYVTAANGEGEDIAFEDLPTDIQALVEEYGRISGDENAGLSGQMPKFSKYQLPGGENYREVLIKLPNDKPFTTMNQIKEVVETKDGEWVVKMLDGRKFVYPDAATAVEARNNFERDLQRGRIDVGTIENKDVFRSSHFEDANIIVHARINDRIVDGKRILFIEEIQSDWHQKGRKEGYKSPDFKTTFSIKQGSNGEWSVVNGKGQVIITAGTREYVESAAKQYNEQGLPDHINDSRNGGVPDAPFKKTWHELMFKRLLDKAVKEGYDAVAWTTGEQQAERYDLSKQVDKVGWSLKDSAGKKRVEIYPKGHSAIVFDVTKDGIVETVRGQGDFERKRIEDVIGKDIAEQIKKENIGVLKGDGLKVGGEGMKGFYDQMLPSFVNKYTKKWGGKVGEIVINRETQSSMSDADNTFSDLIGSEIKTDISKTGEKVHSLEITPAMRESIQSEGQPLFQGDVNPRAQVDLNGPDGKKIITAFKSADVTFLMHEMSHIWFKSMFDYVKSGKADAEYLKHYETVKNWLQVEDAQSSLTREQQEKFATGFEQTLMSGVPVTTDLEGAFRAFRQWMVRIYQDPAILGEPLTPEVKDFFARMIGNPERRDMFTDDAPTESMNNPNYVSPEMTGEGVGYVSTAEERAAIEVEMLAAGAVHPLEYKMKGVKMRPNKEGYLKEDYYSRLPKRYKGSDKLLNTVDQQMQALAMEGFEFSSEDEFIEALIALEPLKVGLSKETKKFLKGEKAVDRVERLLGKKIAPGKVKQLINKYSGVNRGETPSILVTTEEKFMRWTMKEREKASKGGFKAGQLAAKEKYTKIVNALRYEMKDQTRVRKEITAYARALLPRHLQGSVSTLVNDAKTQDDLIRAFIRINEKYEQFQKDTAINELRDLIGNIASNDSIDIGYKQKALDLVNDIDLKNHSAETMERIKAMKNAVDLGKATTVTDDMAEEIAILSKVNIKNLTVSQIKSYTEKLKSYLDLARAKVRVRAEGRKLRMANLLSTLAGGSKEMSYAKEMMIYARTLTQDERMANLAFKLNNAGNRISMAVTPIDVIFDELDGGKGLFDGVNYMTFKATVDASFGQYLDMKDQYQLPIIKLSQELGLNQQNFERIGIYAVQQQRGGNDKLMATMTPQQYAELKDIELTPAEMKWYEAARTQLDIMRDPVAKVMYEQYNKTLDKVKNYFPFVTDWEALSEAEIQERIGQFAEGAIEKVQTISKRNPAKGFTISRVGGKQKINLNAFDVFMKHTDDVSYLVSMAKDLRFLGEVAASEKYGKIAGDRGQTFVRSWIDLMARKGGVSEASKISALDTIRRNIGVGTLGFKLTSMLVQPTSLADAAGRIGGDWVARGVTNIMDPKWVKLVMHMPEVRRRAGDDPAYADFINGLNDGSFIWLRKVQEKGMRPLQYLDMLSAMATAAGSYEKRMAEAGKTIDFEKIDPVIMERAQLDVRRTQSSGFFKDAPMMSTKGALSGNVSLDKFLAQFNNFVMNRFSTIHEVKAEFRRGDVQQLANRTMFFIIATFAVLGVRAGIGALKDLILNDDKDYDFMANLWNEILGGIPMIGNSLASLMTGREASIPVPGVSAVGDVMKSASGMVTAKKPETKAKNAVRFIATAGRLSGLPTLELQDAALRGISAVTKKPSRSMFKKRINRRKINRKVRKLN